jgi:hypothetical protein
MTFAFFDRITGFFKIYRIGTTQEKTGCVFEGMSAMRC